MDEDDRCRPLFSISKYYLQMILEKKVALFGYFSKLLQNKIAKVLIVMSLNFVICLFFTHKTYLLYVLLYGSFRHSWLDISSRWPSKNNLEPFAIDDNRVLKNRLQKMPCKHLETYFSCRLFVEHLILVFILMNINLCCLYSGLYANC